MNDGRLKRGFSRGWLLALAILLVFCVPSSADEPHARSRDYDLQHARMALRFEPEQRKVVGQVTHTLAMLHKGVPQISFDSVGLNIESVALNGKPTKYQTTARQLLVFLDHPAKAGEKFDVTILYEGRPKKGLYFVLPDKNYPNRPVEVWTQGEAEDTRYYIPIYDYPNDRLTSEMILTVPPDWQTVSNGKLVSVTDAPGGMKTWDWRQSQPLSSYLISVVAGEFDVREEMWRNVPLTYYVPKGKADRIPATFERTRAMLDFYSDKLGFPYPWEKYAQTAVDEFVAGGMENTSATTLTVSALQHPQLARENIEGSDELIAHELAHQWFGDLITCNDWANIWLNEGFATYLETLWEEHEYGADAAAYTMWKSQKRWMSSERLYSVPLVTHNFTDATEYAENIYSKGAWVLHMLRSQLGDARFYRALNHYLEKYRGQNVVSADLAKAIEEATGFNVDRFFGQWVYGAGAPRFRISYRYDDSARQVKLTVQQTQKSEGEVGLFHVPVKVEITTPAGRKTFPITVSKASETFTFPADGPAALVLFDAGDNILKSAKFDKSPKEWIYQLKNADAVPDRADAAKALGELRDAAKNSEEVLAALGEAAVADRFWGIRVEALRSLGRIGGSASEKYILAALGSDKPWIRQAAVEELRDFQDDASLASRLEILFREDPAFRVRTAVLSVLAQHKSPNAYELLQTAVKMDSPDDRLRTAALRAMGALGDDRAIPVLLEWSATGKPFAVRTAAISSLGHLDKKNKDITQLLLAYLSEPYRAVRLSTISALGQRGDTDTIAALEKLMESGDLSQGAQNVAEGAVAKLRSANTRTSNEK